MAEMKRRTHNADDDFYSGVCCALAIVAQCDQETLWREIVKACGGHRKLRNHSKRNDNLDIDGFTQYKEELPWLR